MRWMWVLLVSLVATIHTEAAEADFATRMVESTFKLYNKASTATCFLVRPPTIPGAPPPPPGQVLLLTAEHVFSRMSGEQALIVFRKRQGDGSYVRKDWPLPIRKGEKNLWTKHPDFDVAAMRLQLPEGVEVNPLPYDSLVSGDLLGTLGIHVASPLFVLGFPTRFEANKAGFPVSRHGSIASHPLTPVSIYPTFLADFTTFEGDSGGPVFVADPRLKEKAENAPPLILGLVLAQFRHDETVKTLYEERQIHYPLALATIVNAQIIRDTVLLLPE